MEAVMQDIFLTIPKSDLSFLQELAIRMGWKMQVKEERLDELRLAKRKEIDAKLDELQVTGSLRRLVGVVPDTGNKNWKKEKEEYLQEKMDL